VRSALLRNSLRLGVAACLTAALSLRFERIADVWYPLLAVVTVLVHTLLSAWPGVLVSLMVLMIPSLVALNWDDVFNRTLGTAMTPPARWGNLERSLHDPGLDRFDLAEHSWRALGEASR
jgi:hypothetical protein